MGMVQIMVVFQIFILVLCSIHDAISVQAAGLAINPSCQTLCGNVSIPYPFGIGAGCYVDHWFEVVCINDSLGSPKPVLTSLNNLEVLNISLGGRDSYSGSNTRTVRVNYPTFSNCTNASRITKNVELAKDEGEGVPFFFSRSENIFVAMGCDNFASMTSSDGYSFIGCRSNCDTSKVINISSCHGYNCCQTAIAPDDSNLDAFEMIIESIITSNPTTERCKSAFLIEKEWFMTAYPFSNRSYVPVVLDWEILSTSFNSLPIAGFYVHHSTNNYSSPQYDSFIAPIEEYACQWNHRTFYCYCQSGFEGNPYLPRGCGDINECLSPGRYKSYCPSSSNWIEYYCVNTYGSYTCDYTEIVNTKTRLKRLTIGISSSFGLLVLIFVGGWWSYKIVKQRMMIKQKKKNFERNGGLLLRQQLSSHEANFENIKEFNSEDLEKATDNFNVNRILGQGGQGTVYKGMLAEGRIVAVKKSKVIDEGKQLEEFINEIVILSQLNHRNVVKLIGCCLETEVPLLVYEYVPNGTLSQYINGKTEEFSLTWDMRLRIAIEVARALFYLHSIASMPIYHRDIKSTNVLLDDKYRAKVADFGISRSITVDQTHLTTSLVHGTFGYLDPEYFQSCQFTEKSDVYSFGVVLAELLTGEKAISSTRTQESKGLATYFIQLMEENNLFDIIDSRVLKEGKKEEIIAVAKLAKRCLDLSRKKRPAMKEVTMELEKVQMLQKDPNLQEHYQEFEYVQAEMYNPGDAPPPSTMPTSSSDAQPLLAFSISINH